MKDIISIVLSVIAFALSVYSLFENRGYERKRETLSAFHDLQNEVLDELNHYTNADIEEISNDPRSEEYKEISRLLYRIDHFCIGITTKVYNKKVLDKIVGNYWTALYDKLLPVIEMKRRLPRYKDSYCDFERIARGCK